MDNDDLFSQMIAVIKYYGLDNNFIEQMTTGENAKTLWMWLLHNFPPKKLDAVRVSDNLPLAYFVFVERMFLGLKRVDMYPQSRHKKELMDISDASKKLRLLLSAPSMLEDVLKPFGLDAFEICPSESYGFKQIEADKIICDIAFGRQNLDEVEWLLLEARKSAEEAQAKNEENFLNGRDYEDLTDNELDCIPFIEPDHNSDWLISGLGSVSIQEILLEIEKRASQAANTDVLVKKPSSPDARRTFFIRILHDYHLEKFKRPQWDILSLVTTLAFNVNPPLTADDVRPLCR